MCPSQPSRHRTDSHQSLHAAVRIRQRRSRRFARNSSRVDQDLPGYFVQTLDEVLAVSRFPQRLFGAIFLLLAALALTLSTVGLFALTANRVAERTQEIGVRLALGARSREVVWLFMRSGIVLLAIGLSLGLAGSMLIGKTFPSCSAARATLTH